MYLKLREPCQISKRKLSHASEKAMSRKGGAHNSYRPLAGWDMETAETAEFGQLRSNIKLQLVHR